MLNGTIKELVNVEAINNKYSYYEGGEYDIVAIRIQEQEFKLGAIDHISKVWDDGEETEEVLKGICAINVTDIPHIGSGYIGDHIAVICGNRGQGGEDYGEVIIEDPVVVEIIA